MVSVAHRHCLLYELLLPVQGHWQNQQLLSQGFSELSNLLFHLLQDSLENWHLRVGEEGLGFLVVRGNHVVLVLGDGERGSHSPQTHHVLRLTHALDVPLDVLGQAEQEAISLQHCQGIPGRVRSNLALQNTLKNNLRPAS